VVGCMVDLPGVSRGSDEWSDCRLTTNYCFKIIYSCLTDCVKPHEAFFLLPDAECGAGRLQRHSPAFAAPPGAIVRVAAGCQPGRIHGGATGGCAAGAAPGRSAPADRE